MLDYSISWLSQGNEYGRLVELVKFLKSLGVKEDYVGAFRLNGRELAKCTTSLFWIFRCNASLPYCWFSTKEHSFVGNSCQYGNIHLHTYSKEIKKRIDSFAQSHALFEIEQCIKAFEDDGSIKGRQIVI